MLLLQALQLLLQELHTLVSVLLECVTTGLHVSQFLGVLTRGCIVLRGLDPLGGLDQRGAIQTTGKKARSASFFKYIPAHSVLLPNRTTQWRVKAVCSITYSALY